MFKLHRQFDLFDKKVFEKAVLDESVRMIGNFPDEACFFYLVEGNVQVYTSTERIQKEKQEGLVLQCGTYLNEFLCESAGDYCEAIAIHLYPEVIKNLYDKDFPEFLTQVGKVKPIMYRSYERSSLMKSYIDSLQFYFEHPELVSDELLKLKLKELILLLAKTDDALKVQQFLAGLFTGSSIRFKEVIEANIFNNFSLEELAALTGLSLSSFKREFEKYYESSPAKYIKKRKLEQAAKLLKGTELRISDIAYDSGFNDLAHFSKSFQKTYGASPSQYRMSFLTNSLNQSPQGSA